MNMQLRSRKTLGHALGGTAILAATAFGAPALASAQDVEAPTAPDVTTAVTEGKISVTVANPNTGPTTTCGAFVVDALKLPALLQDPAKVADPGFATWQTPLPERVVAEDETTFEVPLEDGIYSVVGECFTLGGEPVTATPQLAALGGPLGSVDLGLIDIGVLLDLVDQLPPQVVDVVADLAGGSVEALPPTEPEPAE